MLISTRPGMTVLYNTRQATLNGSWETIAEEYRRMLQFIAENKGNFSGVYSECFLHPDPDDPANRITEIRIGLIEQDL